MWLTRNCVSVCRITSEQSTCMYIDRLDNSLFRISRDALGTSTSTPHSRKEIPHASCMCLGAGLSCRSTQALYMCDVKETQLCGCAVCSHNLRGLSLPLVAKLKGVSAGSIFSFDVATLFIFPGVVWDRTLRQLAKFRKYPQFSRLNLA